MTQALAAPYIPRTDALPEHVSYRDDGCSVAPHCLECPLVECRFVAKDGIRGLRLRERDPAIRAAHAEGATVDEIAARFHISRRSVFRVVAKG